MYMLIEIVLYKNMVFVNLLSIYLLWFCCRSKALETFSQRLKLSINTASFEIKLFICYFRHNYCQAASTKMAGVTVSSAFDLHDKEINREEFFKRLSKLDVNDHQNLSGFLEDFKFKKLSINGLNRVIIFAGREATALFDDFTLEIWKKYYINEDVAQIAILQGNLPFPLEVGLKKPIYLVFIDSYACRASIHTNFALPDAVRFMSTSTEKRVCNLMMNYALRFWNI